MRASPNFGSGSFHHAGHVAEADRRPAAGGDQRLAQFAGGVDLAFGPHDEALVVVLLEAGAAHAGGLARRLQHVGQGELMGGEGIRVDLHLELTDPAAEERDLGDAAHGQQARPDHPLNTVAQIQRRQVVRGEAEDHEPARGLGHWPHPRRLHPDRQMPGRFGQTLGDKLPGPVDVGAVLEDDRDGGQPLDGSGAQHIQVRSAAEGLLGRQGDELFHLAGRQSRRLDLNDHLRRRELGEGIDSGMVGRVQPGEEEQDRQDDHDCAVVQGPANDGLKHGLVSEPLAA